MRMKALLALVGIAVTFSLVALADDGGLDRYDTRIPFPFCWLDSYSQGCTVASESEHSCEIEATFKRYDILGHPHPLSATVENTCELSVFVIYRWVKVRECTASDSGSGSGVVSLYDVCYMNYGTVGTWCNSDPSYSCTDL